MGELDIFPGWALPSGIPEKGRRVVGDNERHTVILVYLSSQFTDRRLGVQQCLRGKCAQRENHFWFDDLDLPNEVRTARFHLFRLRIAVSGRTMLENIGDEDILAR